MNRKMILALSVFLTIGFFSSEFLHGLGTRISGAAPVHNIDTGLDYASIQESIDASQTVNGNTIRVDAGMYYESVEITKSLAIVGGGRDTTIVDGGGDVVVRIAANNVLVRGFTLKNGTQSGILIDHSSNTLVQENTVTDVRVRASNETAYAIYGSYCDNLTITRNKVFSNFCSGILVTNSFGFTISSNYVHNNGGALALGYGINTNASMNGIITQNEAFENSYDGIGLGHGSVNCTVVGNNVTDNGLYGVWVDSGSEDNQIYDNNIISNGRQASVALANDWNDGAHEGNYWSDYVGVDQNHDGIGDTPYVIEQNHKDQHPLMGPLSIYNTSKGFDVTVVSNSSIVSFAFYSSNSSIRMRVVNKTDSQTGGFCRIRIPHGLMIGLINVTVDGAEPTYLDHNLYDDGNDRWIYFSYQHSEREILVQGNPPPDGSLEGPFPYWVVIIVAIVVAAVTIASVYVVRRGRGRSKKKTEV